LVSKNPILTVHNSISQMHHGFLGGMLRFLIPFLYRRARIITVSNGIRSELIENYNIEAKRIKVISNPVDVQLVGNLAEERIEGDSPCEAPILITIGRLNKEKGHWHLLRVFSEIRKKMQCKLLILGKGELEGYLRKLSNELNIINDVMFLGWQNNPFKYLKSSSLFVLTSLHEGFGNVLIEAMACNLPVISTDCLYGPREILAPQMKDEGMLNHIEYAEFGILVPCLDGKFRLANQPLTLEEQLLAESILRVLTDKNLHSHYALTGRKRAEDFDVNRVVRAYTNLISESREKS